MRNSGPRNGKGKGGKKALRESVHTELSTQGELAADTQVGAKRERTGLYKA